MSNWYDEALKNAKKIDKASSDAVKKDLQAKAREQKTKKEAEKRAKLEEAKKNRGRKKLTPEINAKKDFEAIKKSVMGSSYVAPDGSKPKTIQGTAIYQKGSKQEAREKLKASGKKVTPTTDNKVFENIANEKGIAGTFGRAYTGVGSGFVDSFTAFPSAVASKVTGKDVDVREKMGLNMPENNPLKDSTAYQAGEMGGELLGYSVQNKAFAPLVNSALKGTKLGKMAGETFKQRAAQDLARNAIEAGSIGLAQNIGIAKQQGLEGSEFAKDVALNTGLDLVAGSALDIVPDAVKTTRNALKNTKLAKQAKNVGQVVDTTKKVAETGDLGAKNTLPDPQKFNQKTIADIQNDRLNELAEQIKKADAEAKPSDRVTQTNKRVKTNTASRTARANAKSQELLDEYIKIQNMTPDEYAKYAGIEIPNVDTGSQVKMDTSAVKAADNTPRPDDLTPEAKQRLYKSIEKRSGVKIVEEELPDGLDGYYENGMIHINQNAVSSHYTVLKHELTHMMQTSDMYDDFSKFIFDGIEKNGYDLSALRAAKKEQYFTALGRELSDVETDQELIAEFCGEFLFNSEESIERLARENPSLFRQIYEWIVDTIKKIGADEDTKFLIDAQRKYEKALKTADATIETGMQPLFVRATKPEMELAKEMERNGATPEEIKEQLNLHRGFKRHWLYEVDDSKARINYDALKSGEYSNIRDVLDHPELWERLGSGKKKYKIDNVEVNLGDLGDFTYGQVVGGNKITLNQKISQDDQLGTLLHETQHTIQRASHLPHGASPEFYKVVLKDEKFNIARDDYQISIRKVRDSVFEILNEYERICGKLPTSFHKIKSTTQTDLYGEQLAMVLDLAENKMKNENELTDFSAKVNEARRELLNAIAAEEYIDRKAFEAYQNTAGEIEARDVKDRRYLTSVLRRKIYPESGKRNKDVVFAEDYEPQFSVSGQESFDKNSKLYERSKNLYGETGNKYINEGKNLPKGKTKADKTLPTKTEQAAKANKLKSVSADAKNPDYEMTYEQASKMYDNYKNGTPVKLPGKGDVSKAADTVIGSDYISDEMRTALKDNVSNYVKTTKSNKVTLDNVNAKIDEKGLTPSLKAFQKLIPEGKKITEEDIATGAELIRRLDEKGEYEKALDVADDLIEMMSQAGRTLQAANIFASMTPYGKVRSVRKAAENMSNRYGKKVAVDETLLKKLFEETDPAKADKIKQSIFLDLWNQVPPTLMEKLDAIRYTAMLSSPKTHLRNIFGNTAMYVGKELSDAVETALEKSLFKGKMEKAGALRNKTVLNPLSAEDMALKRKAGELFEDIKDTILNHDVKYIEKGSMRPQDSPVFKGKALESARKFVSGTLEYEDEIFMKINFQNAFAKICKANGLEVGELTPREIRQFTAYATQQAQTATFRDVNALASAMNRAYKYANDTAKSDMAGKIGKGMLKTAMDATVPFKKTPANVLKQGWRYSPGGLIEGMARCISAKDADSLMKGIEILSNGIVGTPILLAGAYMAKEGLVSGSIGNYSDKDTKYKKMLGQQDYSVVVGDKTITMDWLSPYSMPFFVGVELGSAFEDKEFTGTELVDAMASITNPFLEMSMLQGLQSLITANYEENAAQTLIQNTLKSYVAQFIPSISQQFAKTIAKTTTTTSRVNDGTSSGKFIKGTAAQLKSKVPGLYGMNEPDVDMWGRTDTKEDMWDYVNAGLRNIVSPSNIKDMNVTTVDKEILRLYDNLDDEQNAVIPTPASSKVEYKGNEYRMTDKEFTQYKKDLGQYRYKELEKLFKTTEYKSANIEGKADMVKAVYKKANEVAKKNFLIKSGKMTKEEYAMSTIESKGAIKAINSGKTTAVKVTSAKDDLEASSAGNKGILQAYALIGKYDADTIKAVGGMNSSGGYKISDNTIREAQNLKNTGIGLTEIQKIYVDANLDGKSGVTSKEAQAYLNRSRYNQDQRRAIFDALMQNPKTKNPY